MIQFITDNVDMPELIKKGSNALAGWIKAIARSYGYDTGNINYILCNDDKILQTNRQFLQHDYYTDVITFDYSTSSVLNGDIFISLDTVKSNAEELKVNFNKELCRIIIHGVLHLTGQNDKTPETREEMTRKENSALEMLSLEL